MKKFLVAFVFSLLCFGCASVSAATIPDGYIKALHVDIFNNEGAFFTDYDIYTDGSRPCGFLGGSHDNGSGTEICYMKFFCEGSSVYAVNLTSNPNSSLLGPYTNEYSSTMGVRSGFTISATAYTYPCYQFSSLNSYYDYVNMNSTTGSTQIGDEPVSPDTSLGYISDVSVSYQNPVDTSDPVRNQYTFSVSGATFPTDSNYEHGYEVMFYIKSPTLAFADDASSVLSVNSPKQLIGLRYKMDWQENVITRVHPVGDVVFDTMTLPSNLFYTSYDDLNNTTLKGIRLLSYVERILIRPVLLQNNNIVKYSGWTSVWLPKWDLDGSLVSGASYPIVTSYEAYADPDKKPSSQDALWDWIDGTQDYYDIVLPEQNKNSWDDISGDNYNDILDNSLNNESLGSGISRLTQFARSLSAIPDLIAIFFSMFPAQIGYLMLLALTLIPIVMIIKIL